MVKESKARKIVVKLGQTYSIRNVILRLDKSESVNRASIAVYAWHKQGKSLSSRCLVQEHQWMQMTKNPYRKEMQVMFGNNHAWLNGYGVCLD